MPKHLNYSGRIKHEVPQKLPETADAIADGKKFTKRGVGTVMELKEEAMVLLQRQCSQSQGILRGMSIKFVPLHLVQCLRMKICLELLQAV